MFSMTVAGGHAQIRQEKSPAPRDSPIWDSLMLILW